MSHDLFSNDEVPEGLSDPMDSTVPLVPEKEPPKTKLPEHESVDDFEHIPSDLSPVQEEPSYKLPPGLDINFEKPLPAPPQPVTQIEDPFVTSDPFMSSDPFGSGDTFGAETVADDLDRFMREPAIPPMASGDIFSSNRAEEELSMILDEPPPPIVEEKLFFKPPTPEPVEIPKPKPVEVPPPVETKKPVEIKKTPMEKPKVEEVEIISEKQPICSDILSIFKTASWFDPDKLPPRVSNLVYWRDVKKSGAVFGTGLVVLLSLAYCSLISVVAYLSLLALVVTVSFRIYKNIIQAVQKTQDGHPFKELLEQDVSIPNDKMQEVSNVALGYVNGVLKELRRLFLVEDLVDSVKFGVMLWCLTYVGSWFNGLTLVILAFVAAFTLPKVYETNKTQIDQNLDVVRSKFNEVAAKVKSAIPLGKKEKDQ